MNLDPQWRVIMKTKLLKLVLIVIASAVNAAVFAHSGDPQDIQG